MKIFKTGKKSWTNKHQTFTEKIKDLYILGNEPSMTVFQAYQDTTQGLLQLVRDAVRTTTPLRLLGAGWSWTKIATIKDGIMIDTKPLNIVMSLSQKSVSPSYSGDAKKLILAQCGTGIWELNSYLRKNKLSLKTCGASNGQTIVGAMSTGAHGSTIDIGGVQDYVVGMHIIVGENRHIYLERDSNPVVSDSFIEYLGADHIKSDNLFHAALVSFGSFGIIHSVLLETEDLFLLNTNMQVVKYEAPVQHAMDTLDFSTLTLPRNPERPFHFSVAINPYDKQNDAFVYTHYKVPYRTDYIPPVTDDSKLGPGDDAPVFIGHLTDVIPELVPVVVNAYLGSKMKPFGPEFGTLGEIFNNTYVRGKVMSTALGIQLDQVTTVTDILKQVNQDAGPFTGIFAYRYIKSTQATLGFTCFGAFTCIVEMDGIFSKTTLRYYEAVWNKLDELNIPYTFHWGKMTNLNAQKILNKYGSKVNDWVDARHQVLDANCLSIFNSPLLQEWGLDI